MDELIGELATKAGIDSAVAETTVGIILNFLRNEGPSDKIQALTKIPGAEAALAASNVDGALAKSIGDSLMALETRLKSFRLGITDIQNVARELLQFGRDKIGTDQMILAVTPGLSQFAFA
jgi:hypothetical protein